MGNLYVVKRDGSKQEVSFDKILRRIKLLSEGLNRDYVDSSRISQKVIEGLYEGVTTQELDELAAETCASLSTIHPDYMKLAAKMSVDNLHKQTKESFSEVMDDLFRYIDPAGGKPAPLISEETHQSNKSPSQKIQGFYLLLKKYLHILSNHLHNNHFSQYILTKKVQFLPYVFQLILLSLSSP